VTVTGVGLSGADAGNYTVSQPSGLTASISEKNLTISGAVAQSRPYNGSDAAVVDFSAATLNGVVGTDDVSIDSSGYSATFNNKNVGLNKPVTVTGVGLSGADAGNYTVSQPSGLTANISQASLDIYAVSDSKPYDGGTSSDETPTVSGLQGSDDEVTGLAQAFQSKNVLGAGGSTLVVSAYTVVDGNGGGNYVVTTHTASGTITQKELTVTGITAASKPWDGNTTATLSVGGAQLVGVVAGDDVTLSTAGATGTFASSAVGTWTVTVAGLTISGGDAGNYSLTQPTTTASIGAWNALGYGFYAPVGADTMHSVFTPAPALPPVYIPLGMEWNSVKGGSTVPLKFNVYAGSVEMTSLADIQSFQQARLNNCLGSGLEDPIEEIVGAGTTELRYDVSAQQWIQNWKTPKVNSEQCYRAWVTFKDGSSLEAFFKLKK
jgi:YDG domain